MHVLQSTLDPSSDQAQKNRAGHEELLTELRAEEAKANAGGGDKYVARHRKRGKLLARERVELLLDRDSPFLEFGSVYAWGTEYLVGAGVITGAGVVNGVECVITAHDPTVKGGTMNPYTWQKVLRAMKIAEENRLPVINLVESGGADLRKQVELFIPAGRLFHDLSALSAKGIPTISLVFGNSTAGGAYVPGMSDYNVFVQNGAKVFLGGPPLVKMATGEIADDESLGGGDMHARKTGLADYLARDELEAISLGRDIVEHLHWEKKGPGPTELGPTGLAEPPLYDEDELLDIASVDLKVPFDPREVLARVLDGSRFEEHKPLYGTALVTGWGSIHGYPIGVIANARGVLFNEEARKGAEFILKCNQSDIPILFLQNTTGFMVGTEYEQAGIVKDGSKLVNAVTNSKVPHITLNIGASYGAGNYGMSGRSYDPRFLFSWPSSKTAIMGPEQLAGVLSIVAKASAEGAGRPFDEEADARQRAETEARVEAEQRALTMSGQGFDDGIIDPRDTRSVLGIALSLIHSNDIAGTRGYGVFRM
ncbi:acyl-CoA carboxylase subunit beta [Brevibacterium samyangense]|uniref:Carboxyl transferase domain-containing protein n=1 Tax=Brevibacterium samyangense TaxID=366888 RepID=A0ABN2T2Q6_9MICO